MNWKRVLDGFWPRQRQAGAVFGVGLLLVLALATRQSWAALAEPATPTAVLGYAQTVTANAAPSAAGTLTPRATETATPSIASSSTASAVPSPSSVPTDMPAPTQISEATALPPMLPTPDGALRTLDVPILMYHYISTPPSGADAVRRDLSVPPDILAQHLAFLRERGYTSISLTDLVLALQIGQPLPDKPIVLTFDDGYRDAYEKAFPLLQAYGFTGTFFLLTDPIDQGDPAYLSWDQVIEMETAGMAMEAHGHTHDDLQGRSRDYLIWQMLGAKEAIEARTHKPVRFYCYPSGSYDALAVSILHELDYWAAVTIQHGREQCSDRPYELVRLRVHGNYGVEHLAAILGEPLP